MAKFGIWEFDSSFGLIGRPENQPELYITIKRIWETNKTGSGDVWKWPIYFASKTTWFTPVIAKDFNRALFYAHNCLDAQRPGYIINHFDYNTRTMELQAQILKKTFRDTDPALLV